MDRRAARTGGWRVRAGRPPEGFLTPDEDLEPRTVNKHRQVLWSVLELAREPAERDREGRRVGGGFGVATDNPVTPDTKRRQPTRGRLEVYAPEEVLALARAACATRSSRSRSRARCP
jgi:hypothetical protein